MGASPPINRVLGQRLQSPLGKRRPLRVVMTLRSDFEPHFPSF